ncbi:hypothetical protein FCG67_17575 [Rhodococcus oryzae]|uniref:DUF11 domain-containing protein n=1 Tax=Rhodococcus oryzae TaxID=2571143 RepID=A0ABY2RIS5_9NOCA|nr:hypothetical protein [Rhodococcus oryzae]TJZ76514.1 hypothetical protein FCG67_17575 [Rhodococcus oryzae]
MIRSVVGRVATVAATALMVGGGAAVGSGTASADLVEVMVVKHFGDISVTRIADQTGHGPAYVRPGETITITNEFQVNEGPDRLLTRITDHSPDGLEYVPGSARLSIQHGYTYPWEHVPVTPELGPGTVTMSAAPGTGWTMTPADTVHFRATYRVPDAAQDGSRPASGVTFDVAGQEQSTEWNPSSLPIVVGERPDPSAGSGSADRINSGSAALIG